MFRSVSVKRYRQRNLGDNRVIYIHREIMEKHLGRKLGRRELVHHIDENKTNNALSNLVLISPADHIRHHQGWMRKKGKWWKTCTKCKRFLEVNEANFYRRTKIPKNCLGWIAHCKSCVIEQVKRSPYNAERKRQRQETRSSS